MRAAFAPVEDGTKSRCFITSSYDASSHFEETTNEASVVINALGLVCWSLQKPLPHRLAATQVLAMYKRITGEDVDMSGPAEIAGAEGS
jgi:hypothetical protein